MSIERTIAHDLLSIGAVFLLALTCLCKKYCCRNRLSTLYAFGMRVSYFCTPFCKPFYILKGVNCPRTGRYTHQSKKHPGS